MRKLQCWRSDYEVPFQKNYSTVAIAATVGAIEIYNKPDFPYRSETFCILAINGWELLLKAKC